MLVYRLVFLAVAAFTLVCAEEAATATTMTTMMTMMKSSDLSITEINKQYYVDTDTSQIGDHRQGRMSLHAELPSSKAKREQALRNILAAKRRLIMGQRLVEQLRDLRIARPFGGILPKDTSDVLEVQETRHDVYITAPTDVRTEVVLVEDTPEPLTQTLIRSTSEKPTVLADEIRNLTFKYPESMKQIVEPKNLSNENITKSLPDGKEISNSASNSRTNYSVAPRNSSFGSNNQKSPEHDVRRKNTVPMPESLYNHFRPVESNIPVEDMSQFLYFGQKLHPETQNTTSNNNSIKVTPTAPTIPSPRHRFFMKRFSTTTPVPVPKLEAIINEEMNIAVERQTVEKNKISKMKNAFRSPGSGLYYRKPPVKPSDPTICIVCNVIVTPDGKNTSETDTSVKSETDSRTSKVPVNPSAHAGQDQVASEERGSASHEANVTRNAANSTQISDAQRHRGSENLNEEGKRMESEDTVERMNFTTKIVGIVTLEKQNEDSKASFHRNKKSGTVHTAEKNVWGKMNDMVDKETIKRNNTDLLKSIETKDKDVARQRSDFLRNVRTFSIDGHISRQLSGTTVIVPESKEDKNQTKNLTEIDSSSSTSNDIETSTTPNTNERVFASSTVTSLSNHKGPSSRIVVEKTTLNDSSNSNFNKATIRKYDNETFTDLVNGTEVDTLDRSNVRSHHHDHHHTSPLPSINKYTDDLPPSVYSTSSNVVPPVASGVQQHVYAYTITNVTRLLRNYTGPGLSKEEHLASSPSADTSEIRTDSSRGIEAARSRPELSASTAVEGAATTAVVGDRAGAAAASQHWTPSRSGNAAQNVNKVSTVAGPKVDEITGPEPTLANRNTTWDFAVGAKVRNSTDQRVLQKSASAVLNQRTGSAHLDDQDDFGEEVTKRRRLGIQTDRSHDHSLLKNRRVKVLNVGGGTNAAGSSSLMDSRSWSRMGNSSMTERVPKDEVQSRGFVKFAGGRLGVNERHEFQESFDRRGMNSGIARDRLSQGSSVTPNNKRVTSDIPITVPPSHNSSDLTLTTRIDAEREPVTTSEYQDAYPSNQPVLPDTNVRDDNYYERNKTRLLHVAKVNNDSLNDGGVSASAVSSDKDKNVDTDQVKSKFAATLTEKEFESTTIMPKETVQSTVATAVFPVIPKILTDISKVSNRETFSAKPTEDVTEIPEAQTTVVSEMNRPFGIAEDLDPSEIQKMYRLPSTLKPEVTIGTILPETPINEHEDPDASSTRLEEDQRTSSSKETQTLPNERRSPEVRARNLSDKAKDKDNVLPIMHLYNTSDIFNGTDPVDARPQETGSSHFVLPVDDRNIERNKRVDEETSNNAVASTTTANPALGTIPAKTEKNDVPGSSHNTHDQLPDSTEGKPANTRKDKHDGNREASYDINLTTSSKSPSFSTTSRTRFKPTYRPSVFEFSTTSYPSELNRTYFESSLISGNSRESVNISEVISKRHDGDTIATQETVAVVSYILATLVVFPIAVGVGLILRRLIIRNRKVLEESDTSSEISCRKDALNLENGHFKTSIEKAITKLPRIQHLCHEAEKSALPPSQESRWEFPRDKLRLQTVLGQGNFGQVWKAEADDLTGHQGTTRLVAVKTVKEGASVREKEDLVRELEIMQQLSNHPNVVTLLGCCTEEEPHYLILEYVMYGKLLTYLRDHRTRQDFYNFSEDSAALTSRDLTVFGYCVARGMEYLASKKIIHRDLAARNVLVDHNKLCKIADFGMSRFANEDGEVIETRHGRNALPIRWMAPESLIYSLFTTKTDVWSFGILMWEIVTLGSTPYPDMTAREVMRNVQNGYRLERPSHCRSELFRVISRCWHADPDRRPEFQTLRRDLAQLLEDNMNGHYVDLESFASECTD